MKMPLTGHIRKSRHLETETKKLQPPVYDPKAERDHGTYGKTAGRQTKLPSEHLFLLDVVRRFLRA